MSNTVKKLTKPLKIGQNYVYPPTVASQIRLDRDMSKKLLDVMVTGTVADADIEEEMIPINADFLGGTVTADDVALKEDVLTLEEIEASTNLDGKIASAEALSKLNSELSRGGTIAFGDIPAGEQVEKTIIYEDMGFTPIVVATPSKNRCTVEAKLASNTSVIITLRNITDHSASVVDVNYVLIKP